MIDYNAFKGGFAELVYPTEHQNQCEYSSKHAARKCFVKPSVISNHDCQLAKS